MELSEGVKNALKFTAMLFVVAFLLKACNPREATYQGDDPVYEDR